MATGVQIVFDCADPDRMAKFWAAALHYKLQEPPEGYASWEDWLKKQGVPEALWNMASAVVDPDGVGSRLFFQQVPEPKSVKNRLHLDLNISGGPRTPLEERKQKVEAEVERLITVGANQLSRMEQRGEFWIVMADPEGNEFCVH